MSVNEVAYGAVRQGKPVEPVTTLAKAARDAYFTALVNQLIQTDLRDASTLRALLEIALRGPPEGQTVVQGPAQQPLQNSSDHPVLVQNVSKTLDRQRYISSAPPSIAA